ncbi:MAG: hypothetical protein JSU94_18450 [Phycisphaerales bacterium]|nr:MAG: hypothetical protein JSU94_18450 [Phycisphaerales bacterium]
MRRFATALVLLGTAVAALTGDALAAPVTINIEGVVAGISDYSPVRGEVRIGDLITGSYTYDSSAPDARPDIEHYGRYEFDDPWCGIELNVGDFSFASDAQNPSFAVSIMNDRITTRQAHDIYEVQSLNNLPFAPDVPIVNISFMLYDSSAEALGSTALPATAPVLSDWPHSQLWINGEAWAGYLYGEVTSLTLVPEPAGGILLALGLPALLRRRRYPRAAAPRDSAAAQFRRACP